MGSITAPQPQKAAETPFDHFAALLGLIADPKAHSKRLAELKQAHDAHAAVERAATEARKGAAAEREAADTSAAYAQERHEAADARERDLAQRAQEIAAAGEVFDRRRRKLAEDVAAFNSAKSDTEAAHATLNDEIAAKHAQVSDALRAAQNAREEAEAAKGGWQRLKDDATAALAKAKAILAAAEG